MLTDILGLILVFLVFGLIIVFLAASRNRPGQNLREISAFARLRKSVGLAVEAGTRIHISLGWGFLGGIQSATAFAGLSMLERIARAASISDRPPVATSGDASLAILSRDTLRSAYRSLGAESQEDPSAGRLVGLTPFSYAAGVLPVIEDEQISTNVLVGHFGSEIGLVADAAERRGQLAVAGTDSLPGQAVLVASAGEPLIGEEVFAGGAYLGAGQVHNASLRAQDFLRWLVIIVILVGAVLKLFGLDHYLSNLLPGVLP